MGLTVWYLSLCLVNTDKGRMTCGKKDFLATELPPPEASCDPAQTIGWEATVWVSLHTGSLVMERVFWGNAESPAHWVLSQAVYSIGRWHSKAKVTLHSWGDFMRWLHLWGDLISHMPTESPRDTWTTLRERYPVPPSCLLSVFCSDEDTSLDLWFWISS